MPEDRQVVVTNTTPIISLALVNKLELLLQLYNEVLIPPAVYSEVIAGGLERPGMVELDEATWIRLVHLSEPDQALQLSNLDRGEAEAIALAQELKADLLIVDERLARRHARRLNIPITGTMGVLLRAKERLLINEVRPYIEQMQLGGIRLDSELVRDVLLLAEEDN